MQIERVYKDSYGTVWMYATCNVRRTHNHKNKKRNLQGGIHCVS